MKYLVEGETIGKREDAVFLPRGGRIRRTRDVKYPVRANRGIR